MPGQQQQQQQEEAPPLFRIIAGTYERLLYGLNVTPNSTQESKWTLDPLFVYPSHISCIKSIACTHKLLATGSTDESIKLYDLHRLKEVGSLLAHNGSITSLHFIGSQSFLSASEDGSLILYRTKDWEKLKELRGHHDPTIVGSRGTGTGVGGVSGVSVHPTGRLALSVGGRGKLCCWDLLVGRCAYVEKIDRGAEGVLFSQDDEQHGQYFAIRYARKVVLRDMTTMVMESAKQPQKEKEDMDVKTRRDELRKKVMGIVIESPSRINTMAFSHLSKSITLPVLSSSSPSPSPSSSPSTNENPSSSEVVSDILLLGCDDAKIRIYSAKTGNWIATLDNQTTSRIKDMACMSIPSIQKSVLATASSEGLIRLWDIEAHLQKNDDGNPLECCLGEYNAKCRLTCIAISLMKDPGNSLRRELTPDKVTAHFDNQENQEDEEKSEDIPKKNIKHQLKRKESSSKPSQLKSRNQTSKKQRKRE